MRSDTIDGAARQLEQQLRHRLEADAMVMFDDLISDGATPEYASAEVSRFCTAANARNAQIVATLRQHTRAMAGRTLDELDAPMRELQRSLDALQPQSSVDWRRLS